MKNIRDFLKFKELLKIEIKKTEAHTTSYRYFLSNYKNNNLTRDIVGGGPTDTVDNVLQDFYDDYYTIEMMTASQIVVNILLAIPAYGYISRKYLTDVQEIVETIPCDEEIEDKLWWHDVIRDSEIFYDFDFLWFWG